MSKIKIGIIGNGWRSQTFFKIIEELHDIMELKAVLFRNGEKAAQFAETHPATAAFTELEEFLKLDYDYVMLALPRSVVLEYLEYLWQRNIPVLCETPPGDGVGELIRCWELKEKYNGRIQVVEQYFLQPYHAAVLELVRQGSLGTVSNLNISMMHDYHGISMMRKLLGTGFQGCTIKGRRYDFPVTRTCGRDGMDSSGKVEPAGRKRAVFEFENQAVGFFDFCDEQYFNYLRSRHLNVQGDRGELFDNTVTWLDEQCRPFSGQLTRVDTGLYSNLEGYFHRGIQLCGKYLYESPFAGMTGVRLNDDEIAIATVMMKMKEYVDHGTNFYPLAEALQDTYLYLMMDKAIETGESIAAPPQIWTK